MNYHTIDNAKDLVVKVANYHFVKSYQTQGNADHLMTLVEKAEKKTPETDGTPWLLQNAMRYSLMAGGKRLRPAMLLAAADMPFAEPEAAKLIAGLCGDADACIMTDENGRIEPLFSFYRPAALLPAEKALREGRRSMRELFADIRIRTVGPDDLGELWTDRLLINVNDPADYERLCLELERDK